tara:strand:- start:196 stop:456 length:261 start_codon:yes stop_codon:yes gene_type:complete
LILPPDAKYEEFRDYVVTLRGPVDADEIADLWEWRQKLLGIRIVTGRGYRERECPVDEQHLTMREREKKVIAEAEAAGITVERASA